MAKQIILPSIGSRGDIQPYILEEVIAAQPDEAYGNTSGNIIYGGFVAASDGWVYFSIPGDARLIKMQADGSEKQVISQVDVTDNLITFTVSQIE